MKSTENKNRKPKTSNLPLSMSAGLRAGLKIGAVALGFISSGAALFGSFWSFLFCYDLLRGILSCLLSLVVLIGFFSFLFSQIF